MSEEDKTLEEAIMQLDDYDEKTRSYAALSLGWLGDQKVIKPLIHTLKTDCSSKVRANAAMSLGQLNDRTAIQPLISTLSDEDPFVRGMIIYSLGLMKAVEATDALIEILEKDLEKETRMAAADSLAQLGNEKAIYPLIKSMIHDSKKDVRDEAKESLKRLSSFLNYPNIQELIDMEEKKITGQQNISHEEQPIQILDQLKQRELEIRKKEKLEIINKQLPSLLEYALHNETISFDMLCKRFNCDAFIIELALTKLNENKIINVIINGKNKSFTVLKPQVDLSEEAQTKLKLLRKKFGIDW